nr:mitochondrial GTPase 1-like isoform X3 [Lepeophtheirus salmonis]
MTVNAAFRKAFEFPFRSNPNWYPGHMRKSLKQLQSLLSITDCVLEVHDARIPLSGRNVDFKRTLTGVRPHILVLNKADLSLHGNQDRKNLITQLKMQDPSLSEGGNDAMSRSKIQSQVLSLYKQCMRAGETKVGFNVSIRNEFKKNKTIPKTDSIYIEYLLRGGKRKLNMIKDPHVSGIGYFVDDEK